VNDNQELDYDDVIKASCRLVRVKRYRGDGIAPVDQRLCFFEHLVSCGTDGGGCCGFMGTEQIDGNEYALCQYPGPQIDALFRGPEEA
jgi:hypothetical protein